jgi:3-oxoacyl-[acyl-carrier-protein] synthase II
MNRHAQLACVAALVAAESAGLKVSGQESYRTGVFLGTSIAGMNNILEQHKIFLSQGIDKVQPFEWLGGSVGDSTAEISLLLKLQGPCHTICTGSASSADAIGHAFRAIQSGYLDVAVVGGAEAPIFLEMLSLFHRTGVLASDDKAPLKAMKPFDMRRNGFVLGEGAAFLVLENMDRAIKRNADLKGEIVGYGNSCDAHHAFASDPLGRGMASAIQEALKDANLSTVDYINVHGTGTLVGDTSETRAIKRAFNKDAGHVALSSTKPFTGHLLGAAGAMETIFTLLAMKNGVVPPTLNLEQSDPECDLNFTPLYSKQQSIRTALNMNSGFGGKNAVLVMKNMSDIH